MRYRISDYLKPYSGLICYPKPKIASDALYYKNTEQAVSYLEVLGWEINSSDEAVDFVIKMAAKKAQAAFKIFVATEAGKHMLSVLNDTDKSFVKSLLETTPGCKTITKKMFS